MWVIKSNDCNILPSRVFNALLGGSPFNFVTAVGLEKIRMTFLQDRLKRFC